DIRIDIILEFKSPATTGYRTRTHLPIAACGNLLLQEPLDCMLHAGMLTLHPGTTQGQEYPGCIPDRRHTSLKTPPGLVLQREALLPLDATAHDRVIGAHAFQI